MPACSDDAEPASPAADAESDAIADIGPADAAGSTDIAAADTTKASDAGTAPAPAKPWPKSQAFVPHRPNKCPRKAGADDLYGKLLSGVKCRVADSTGSPTRKPCTVADVGIPKAIYDGYGGNIGKDPQRLAHFHPVQADLSGLGACWATNLYAGADAAVSSDHPMTSALADAAAGLGVKVNVGGLFVLPDAAEPLVEALRALHIQGGGEFDEKAARAAAKSVPKAVQEVAAKILLGALAAIPLRDEFLAKAGHPKRYNSWFNSGVGLWLPQQGYVDPDNKADSDVFVLASGYDKLFEGGGRLLQALDETDLLSAATDKAFDFTFTTPYGTVVIRGGGDDVYEPTGKLKGDLLLVLDTGGNDTYRIRAGANTSVKNPASVLVDLDGDDTYAYPEAAPAPAKGMLPGDADGRQKFKEWLQPASLSKRNRQGAGRLGYGLLVDLGASNDTYRSLRMSQGYANFGVGVLWDDGGDDTYTAESGSQAAAFVGIAILHDGGGKDSYRAFQSSQAFGWMSSIALLYDRNGDDKYECVVDEVLIFDSPQTPKKANGSLCQGTAFGVRRDKTKTHRSGGIALLRDKAGADRYIGSTFTQGTGYWMGTGILADGGGNDRYDGLFYAQGAAAHFAIGMLFDEGGDDAYNGDTKPINCTIGCGHDFSSALVVDESGNDTYRGKSRAMGAAKCHGHGLFVDNGGDDKYESTTNKSIGWATDYDGGPGSCGNYKHIPSYGFFVDIGGKDTYTKPDASAYGDGKTWITDDPDDKDALELSGGIDAASGDAYIHAK